MILTPDLRHELMINYVNREKYLRPLNNEEIFNVLSDKYEDDQAEILLDKLLASGLNFEEIVEYAFRREDDIRKNAI